MEFVEHGHVTLVQHGDPRWRCRTQGLEHVCMNNSIIIMWNGIIHVFTSATPHRRLRCRKTPLIISHEITYEKF